MAGFARNSSIHHLSSRISGSLPLVAGATAILALSGCSEKSEHIPRYEDSHAGGAAPHTVSLPPNFKNPSEFSITPASYQDMPEIVHVMGQIQTNETSVTRVTSPLAGRVIETFAVLGEDVPKGRTMFTVSSEEVGELEAEEFNKENDLNAELERELLQLGYETKEQETKLGFAKKILDRCERLIQEKIGSQAALDAARNEFDTVSLTVQSLKQKKPQLIAIADSKRRLYRQGLRQRLLLLGMPANTVDKIINSQQLNPVVPIVTAQPGVVLERQINPGELIPAGKLAFLVDDLDAVWLVAEVYEKDVKAVHIGQAVNFTVDSYPGETFHGILSFVDRAINPEARTMKVRADVANIDRRLKPKMFSRMNIVAGTRKALVIPKSAVVSCGSNNVVYLKRPDGRYEERTVETGLTCHENVEVLTGLLPGDAVVSKGAFTLRACSLSNTE